MVVDKAPRNQLILWKRRRRPVTHERNQYFTREKTRGRRVIAVDVCSVLITDWQMFNLHCAELNNELKYILTHI